jgi:hypothetical protein
MGKRRRRPQSAIDVDGHIRRAAQRCAPVLHASESNLDKADFDGYVEPLCQRLYADEIGRPGLPLESYFRLLLIGYFETATATPAAIRNARPPSAWLVSPGARRIGEAERMPAIAAHVLRIAAAPADEADTVRGEEADQRMAHLWSDVGVLEERMAAEAGVFNEAIAPGDPVDAVAEQAAGVADLLIEDVAVRERVGRRREDERVPAPHAHVLVMPVAPGEQHVGVVPQEARERVPDTRDAAVLRQVRRAAAARAAHVCRPKDPVVHRVAPDSAAHPRDDLTKGGHAR